MIITIIIILCIIVLALTGLCVWLCHSLKQERELRWDEISRSVTIENDYNALQTSFIDDIATYRASIKWYQAQKEALQDFKSATLCPTNNHIWVDGVCTKCGRVQDAAYE